MARSVSEWKGKTDDEMAPPRVRLRVLNKFGKCCALCRRPIRGGTRWTCDHIKALINEGENRENNLQPLCCWCAPEKDAADVAEKSKVAKKAKNHFGIKRKSRPMAGARNSPWKQKMDGTVERRT